MANFRDADLACAAVYFAIGVLPVGIMVIAITAFIFFMPMSTSRTLVLISPGRSTPELPTELLATIFVEGLPEGRNSSQRDTYIRALLHTCSYWRDVAFDTRKLWTQLAIDLDRCSDAHYLEHIAARVERSHRYPVDVVLRRPLPGMMLANSKPQEAAQLLDRLVSVLNDAIPRVQVYTVVAEPINTGAAMLPLDPSLFPALQSLHFEGKAPTCGNASGNTTSTISCVELYKADLASLSFKSVFHSLNFSSIPSERLTTLSYLVRAAQQASRPVSVVKYCDHMYQSAPIYGACPHQNHAWTYSE